MSQANVSAEQLLEEIGQMVLKMSVVTDHLVNQANNVVVHVDQSAQKLDSRAAQLSQSVLGVNQNALGLCEKQAANVLGSGLAEPIRESDAALKKSISQIQGAAEALQKQMLVSQKQNVAFAWKTLIACVLAAIVVFSATGIMGWSAKKNIERTEWVGYINAAIAAGKLVACPDGGLCVNLNGKITRIDK